MLTRDWLLLALPVCLMETCRVEFLQQEMRYYVKGIFVGFVEHVPGGALS